MFLGRFVALLRMFAGSGSIRWVGRVGLTLAVLVGLAAAFVIALRRRRSPRVL